MLQFLLLFACRDEVIEDDPIDTTENVAVCEDDDDCGSGTICEIVEGEADCVDGDRNNDPDSAESILWEDTADGVINPAGDVDYYQFTARGGEYIRITTTSDFGDADTVVTLRDPTGQVLTWSDDFPTGSQVSSLDSVIYAHLPYAGDYLISVEDYYAYLDPNDAYGHPNYTYTLELGKWSQATQEDDSIESPSLSLDLERTNMWNSIGILIDDDGDSDWVEINYTAKDEDGNDAKFLFIEGIEHLDGSELNPTVNLYDANQNLLATHTDVGTANTIAFPDMAEGTYFVEVTDAQAKGSEAHWTYIFLLSRANRSYPLDMEPNESSETAQSIEMIPLETESESAYAVGYQMGYLESTNDEDWYQFPHEHEGGQLIVCLNSSIHGSTSTPMVELFDQEGAALGEQTCDTGSNPNLSIVLDEIPLGDISIKVTDINSSSTSSDWYQMLVYSTSFEASSFACP